MTNAMEQKQKANDCRKEATAGILPPFMPAGFSHPAALNGDLAVRQIL